MLAHATVKSLLEKWAFLGLEPLSFGSMACGRFELPDRTEYLIRVFGALTDEQINNLERELHCPLPAQLREFYRYYNGFALFRGWFRLFGFSDNRRDLGEPIDIILPNLVDDFALENGFLRISSYPELEPVYLAQDGVCVVFAVDLSREIARWNSLSDWIGNEIERYCIFMNADGSSKVDFSTIGPPIPR